MERPFSMLPRLQRLSWLTLRLLASTHNIGVWICCVFKTYSSYANNGAKHFLYFRFEFRYKKKATDLAIYFKNHSRYIKRYKARLYARLRFIF